MRRGLLPLLICVCGCVAQNSLTDRFEDNQLIALDFRNCAPDNGIQKLELVVPPGYDLKKVEEHGFCEYRFIYQDQSILYVTSNTFDGSKLNYENRLDSDIRTYSTMRSENDTIQNSGAINGLSWLEWINGSYVIGYTNNTDSLRFAKAIKSVKVKFQ